MRTSKLSAPLRVIAQSTEGGLPCLKDVVTASETLRDKMPTETPFVPVFANADDAQHFEGIFRKLHSSLHVRLVGKGELISLLDELKGTNTHLGIMTRVRPEPEELIPISDLLRDLKSGETE